MTNDADADDETGRCPTGSAGRRRSTERRCRWRYCGRARFVPAAVGLVGAVAVDRRPMHVVDTDPGWSGFPSDDAGHLGIRSFVGYPLLVADRLVGVLAVYAPRPVSDLLITAISSVVASLSLAMD